MKKLYYLLLLIFLGISTHSLKAQNSFSKDSIAYFNEMEAFLSNARKEGKDFMKQFKEVWYGGYFTEKQREGVYSISNKMLRERLRPFPDFRNFLFTVGSFVVDENQTEESFQTWESIILELLNDRKKRKFTEFLQFSNYLFRENAMYVSASTKWAANNSNYIFGYDGLPKITFESLDLICYARKDSMKIYDTKGVYYPTEHKWVGEGGKVTWERADLLADEVYADLRSYEINTKKFTYQADSVTFYNSFYFDRPLIGELRDKLIDYSSKQRLTYPQFDSYTKRLRIENIAPNVNFDGGFSMVGNRFLGKGDKDKDAILEFYRNDSLFLKTASQTFAINTERIVSDNASVRFYLGQDSIFHPGLNFKFFMKEKKVTLYKEQKGLSLTPYFNTFHKLDMDFEQLTWKTDEPIIRMSNLVGGSKNDAFFTSSNYFKKERFDEIGGADDINPMFRIKRMVDQADTTALSITELSYVLNIEKAAARNLVMQYTTLGFMSFDFDEDLFFVKQRLIDYVNARNKKIDYDVINIYSNLEEKDNAQLNLLNYDLTVNGVKGIVLSDSQKVFILPKNRRIKVKRNRYIEFAGQVKAGRFDFYGKEFSFDYGLFKINLTNVDSLRLKAFTQRPGPNGDPVLAPVKTVIQNVNGDLLIDNSDNKSGLKDYPQYPIFNSFDDSYVFYNKQEVQGGVYKKDNFYFQLEPFTIDSLDNFDNDQLAFEGTFSSAGIFPEFDEVLTLQEDHSLGFVRGTPPGGFAMYNGKGKFYDDIKLSHEGLRGDGKLEYLTSTAYSDDFIFHPDSMRAMAQEFFIEEQKANTEYPPVKGVNSSLNWQPKKDLMYTTTKTDPLFFYDGKSKFDGTTTLSPEALEGDGLFQFERADLESHIFVFKFTTFDADTADFRLKDGGSGGFALKTTNVNAHVDYRGRFAEFKANGKSDPIEFPINQYICFMEEFKWYMDDGAIELSSSSSKSVAADVKLEGSKFISTHPEQDSLFFYAPLARYDSRRHIISAKDVLYINSADARVYPDSGDVIIEKKASMQPLVNSAIVANSVTEYHNIYNSNVVIRGRKSYTGSGYIDYVDETKIPQSIYLHNIRVDTSGQTIANGAISDTTIFTLSPQFEFRGGVKLFANKEFLVFDGATRIGHDCKLLSRPWIVFEAEVNPLQIYIPVDTSMKDTSGAVLLSSVVLNTDSTFMYSAFLTGRSNYSDVNVLPAYGFLNYDKESNEYRISSIEKINEPSLPGNYLSLDLENCKIYGEGTMDLGIKSGNITYQAAGNISHNQVDNDMVLDMFMTVDFFFDDALMKQLATNINNNLNLQPVDFSRETYEKGLREVLGVEEAEKQISQLNLNGKFKRLPDQLNKRIVFNDVKFKWNEDDNSYVSFGQLGISNINKEEVNKYINGNIRITKKRSGDVVDIYLEIDETTWYYFNYRRGLMYAVSSLDEFNNGIKELKPDKRKYDHKRGEEPFSFTFGTDRKRKDFLRSLESDF